MRDFHQPGRSPAYSGQGMAATSQPLATHTALEVLRNGGNAMDAALAAVAVQCVVEPGSTGIGGDCFCLYAPGGSVSQLTAFNGSGTAPAAASVAALNALGVTELDKHTAHSVTVPGAVDAWFQLHARHGSVPMAELLQPAIGYAGDGFALGARTAFDFAGVESVLAAEPSTAAVFLPGGRLPKAGELLKQPQLAASLHAIADGGADAFYRADIAADIVSYLNEKGGLHTRADFEAYTGQFVTPISSTFRGRRVHQCPPNGQGVIALLLLNMISEIDTYDSPLSPERVHREIEACRLAYTARNTFLADPDHSAVPVEEILSADYADALRAQIDPERAREQGLDVGIGSHPNTVYLTVVDKDRNVCSLINTLFYGFGSGLTAPQSGVVLQNRGFGFSMDPTHPNALAPNKRPMHTIIPGMVSEGDKVVMSYGVMGGHYQAFGHMQFLTRMYDYGCNPQSAMDLPRFMVDPDTGEVEIESTVDQALRDGLVARGHRLVTPSVPVGGSQAIAIDWEQGTLCGGSDPRKDGCALGY
ncbi:MAG: gamma-glutamyltransferase [Pseudomonadota bacterium]